MAESEKEEVKLTPSQERVLTYIAVQTATVGQARISKEALAKLQHCSVKTVDRAIARLKSEGLIEVVERHLDNGGQIANAYRLIGIAGHEAE